MASLNKVMIIGRLGNDPEKKVTQSGNTIVSLSLATSEFSKDQQGNKKEKTEWHKVVLWNKMADLAEKFLKKGSQVYIDGRLQTSEWQDKDGNKRYKTEVVGQTMQFLDSKGESNKNEYMSEARGIQRSLGVPQNTRNDDIPKNTNIPNRKNTQEMIEDDIPF